MFPFNLFPSGCSGKDGLNMKQMCYSRGAQPVRAKDHSVLFLMHSRVEDKIMISTSKSSIQNRKQNLFSLFVARGLI